MHIHWKGKSGPRSAGRERGRVPEGVAESGRNRNAESRAAGDRGRGLSTKPSDRSAVAVASAIRARLRLTVGAGRPLGEIVALRVSEKENARRAMTVSGRDDPGRRERLAGWNAADLPRERRPRGRVSGGRHVVPGWRVGVAAGRSATTHIHHLLVNRLAHPDRAFSSNALSSSTFCGWSAARFFVSPGSVSR